MAHDHECICGAMFEPYLCPCCEEERWEQEITKLKAEIVELDSAYKCLLEQTETICKEMGVQSSDSFFEQEVLGAWGRMVDERDAARQELDDIQEITKPHKSYTNLRRCSYCHGILCQSADPGTVYCFVCGRRFPSQSKAETK